MGCGARDERVRAQRPRPSTPPRASCLNPPSPVWPDPTYALSGVLSTKPGPMLAASTRFGVTIQGRGGHAAMPHTAIDPVVAAAQVQGPAGGRGDGRGACGRPGPRPATAMPRLPSNHPICPPRRPPPSQAVLALQPVVSRETSPVDPVVVSVTRFNTGAARAAGPCLRAHSVPTYHTRAWPALANVARHAALQPLRHGPSLIHLSPLRPCTPLPSPFPQAPARRT